VPWRDGWREVITLATEALVHGAAELASVNTSERRASASSVGVLSGSPPNGPT
jgi:hypothetical protein